MHGVGILKNHNEINELDPKTRERIANAVDPFLEAKKNYPKRRGPIAQPCGSLSIDILALKQFCEINIELGN